MRLLLVAMMCLNVCWAQTDFIPVPFSENEFNAFSKLPGNEKILFFKYNSFDSCFLLDRTQLKAEKIDTRQCDIKGKFNRIAFFQKDQFFLIDQCVMQNFRTYNIYSISKNNAVTLIKNFNYSQPLEFHQSNGKKFVFGYIQTITSDSCVTEGIITNDFADWRPFRISFPIDSGNYVCMKPFADHEGVIHQIVYTEPNNYRLNTEIYDHSSNDRESFGQHIATLRKQKIINLTSFTSSLGNSELNILTLCSSGDYKKVRVNIEAKAVSMQIFGLEEKRMNRRSNFYLSSNKDMGLVALESLANVSNADLYCYKSPNELTVLKSSAEPDVLTLTFNAQARTYSNDRFEKWLMPSQYSYTFIDELNAFLTTVNYGRRDLILFRNFTNRQTSLFEIVKDETTDLTGSFVFGKEIWIPSYRNNAVGYKRIRVL